MDNKVHIMLKSNYDTPVLCFLFNRRGMRVDTKMYNPSQDPYISFDIPSMKLSYRVQCSAMNERQKGRQELEEGKNNAECSLSLMWLCGISRFDGVESF